MYILLYLLIVFADTATRTSIALNGAIIHTIVFFALFYTLIKSSFKDKVSNNPELLNITLILSVALGLLFRISLYQTDVYARLTNSLLQTLALLVIVTAFLLKSYKTNEINSNTRVFKIMITIAIVARLLLLFTSPNPAIDTFVEMKEAPKILFIEGKNPYTTNMTQVYGKSQPNPYSYLPGPLFLVAPFAILLEEPRILFFISEFIAGILIYKLSIKSIARIILLIYFYNPVSLFILESSWLEPLIIMLIVLVILLIRQKKFVLSGVIMGVVLSIKQNLIFLPFFIIKSKIATIKTVLISIICLFLIITPFIIWSPKAFYEEIFLFLDKQGYGTFTHGVTFGRLIRESLHLTVPNFTAYFLPIIFTLIALSFVKKNIKSFLLGFIISQYSLFIFGRIGNINYYYLISILILLLYGVRNFRYGEKENKIFYL